MSVDSSSSSVTECVRIKVKLCIGKSSDNEEDVKKKIKLVINVPLKLDTRAYPEIPDELTMFEVATQHIPEGWEDEFTTKRNELKILSNLLDKCLDTEEIAPSNFI